MRSVSMFFPLCLSLFAIFATPISDAGSVFTAPVVQRVASDIDTSRDIVAGTSSVRMKVSPVTYSGPQGHRKPSAARVSEARTLHASVDHASVFAFNSPEYFVRPFASCGSYI